MSVIKRYIFLLTIDAIIIGIVILLTYFLHFEFQIDEKYYEYIPFILLMQYITIFFFFTRYRLYKKVWQYASIGELIAVINAVVLSEAIFFIFHKTISYFYPVFSIPNSLYIIFCLLIILAIGGSRLIWRVFRDNYLRIQSNQKRALIVGAGNAGALIVKELVHSKYSDIYPIAFIDDDITKKNLEILGLKVVGTRDDINKVVGKLNIDEIIIAIPSAPKSEISKIVNICKDTRINTKILPSVSDIINGKISINMIRNVNLEDLLGRETVKVNLNEIMGYVNKKIVLVTGAGGSIGSELSRQIANYSPSTLLLLGHGENSIYDIELELKKDYPILKIISIIADVQDKQRIESIFELYKPNVVFHAAAHKHVPLMENNPIEAIKNNVFGTKNVAECANKYKANQFVLVSTDKAVNPTSIMGTTKKIAEMFVQFLSQTSETKFVVVRFGNVLGSRGSAVPIFKKQIELGGPITITHPDMVRFFMTIPEAVQLVIQAGALAKGGEVFVLDMGKPIKIEDLANDLIRLSGLEPVIDIEVVYTGIRPGEKLYEEILTNEEGIVATKHNRIFVSNSQNVNKRELFNNIRKLEYLINNKINSSCSEIKNLLFQIVPSYKINKQSDKDKSSAFGKELLQENMEHIL
ncbi:MAG: polysaccharide biosynthesis protein [Vulcanibacillus sp.]